MKGGPVSFSLHPSCYMKFHPASIATIGLLALGFSAQQALAQDMVLAGNTLLVGVNGGGSLQENTVAGPTPTSPFIGIQYDNTGTGNYSKGYDFLTPGDPFQYYAVGVNGTWATQTFSGDRTGSSLGSNPLGMTTTNTSAGGTLSANSTGGMYNGLAINQSLSFQQSGAGSGVIVFTATLTNTTAATMGDVAFSTGLDPDQDVYFDGEYATSNVVVNSNFLYGTGLGTAWTIGIDNLSASKYASTAWINSGFWDDYGADEDPFLGTNSEFAADGTTSGSNYGDYSLNMDWDLGALAAGGSITLTYDYVIAATPAAAGAPDSVSTLCLLGLALLGLGLAARRRTALA
jgi:hypothetical protein